MESKNIDQESEVQDYCPFEWNEEPKLWLESRTKKETIIEGQKNGITQALVKK